MRLQLLKYHDMHILSMRYVFFMNVACQEDGLFLLVILYAQVNDWVIVH